MSNVENFLSYSYARFASTTTTTIGDRTKWYWRKWYGQNGSNFYRFQFNLIEFLFSNHKSQISDKPK